MATKKASPAKRTGKSGKTERGPGARHVYRKAGDPCPLTKPSSVARFLRHFGEPTEAPTMAPARDPPDYRARAVRRTLGELDPAGGGAVYG